MEGLIMLILRRIRIQIGKHHLALIELKLGVGAFGTNFEENDGKPKFAEWYS